MCPICALGKMTQVRKGKTVDTSSFATGELFHIDFEFWDTLSRRGFTVMIITIDAKTRNLWLFCTTSKKPPIHILRWFFSNLRCEGRTLVRI
jgi:hypothetical protein